MYNTVAGLLVGEPRRNTRDPSVGSMQGVCTTVQDPGPAASGRSASNQPCVTLDPPMQYEFRQTHISPLSRVLSMHYQVAWILLIQALSSLIRCICNRKIPNSSVFSNTRNLFIKQHSGLKISKYILFQNIIVSTV